MTLLTIQVAPKATVVLSDLCRCKYFGKFSGISVGETSQILHSFVNWEPGERGVHILDLLHIPLLAKQVMQPTAYSMLLPAFVAK